MFALSQRKILAGVIKDAHSDEPVVFASVKFINSSIGKLSDSSGTFVFNLAHWPSDSLEITCVGYQPHKLFIPANSDSLAVEITMERGTLMKGPKLKLRSTKACFSGERSYRIKPAMINSDLKTSLTRFIINWSLI